LLNSERADSPAPALEEVATGPQLERTRAEAQANKAAGVAFKAAAPSVARRDVNVESIEGDLARLTDCAVNDGVVYRISTGEVLSDSVSTRSIDAVMRRVGDRWLLESTSVVQEWEGVAGCALSS
jgi:hypothetical protein